MPYATAADVQARLANRVISSTSKPSDTQVATWITETEAELNGELRVAKFTTPVTGTDPIAIVKAKVVSRVAARVLAAYAAGTDFGEDELVAGLNKEWDDFLHAIRTAPARVGELIGQPVGGDKNRGAFRSHVTDNSKGLSAADGDFDPVFTTKDEP